MPGGEFSDPAGIDIQSGDVEILGERDGKRQTDVAEPDDGDALLTMVDHDLSVEEEVCAGVPA